VFRQRVIAGERLFSIETGYRGSYEYEPSFVCKTKPPNTGMQRTRCARASGPHSRSLGGYAASVPLMPSRSACQAHEVDRQASEEGRHS
jgi:hypothetical protein